MKIASLLKQEKPFLSFEVFPPKTDATYDSVVDAALKIAELKPAFMSVTYGAGGGTSQHTINVASQIQKQKGVTALAHLSCISSTKEQIYKQLDSIKEHGIENILALRGDIPANAEVNHSNAEYKYATQLVNEIVSYGDFCIGAACYPEGHPESENTKTDILHLKEKVDAGCSFLTTQMFFDNTVMYSFLYRIREAGINIPVFAGIMPVTSISQIKRICKLSGTYLPARFKAIADKFGDNPAAMKQAGIAYATEQIIDLLANGVKGIHVYSMNNYETAFAIKNNLSEIL